MTCLSYCVSTVTLLLLVGCSPHTAPPAAAPHVAFCVLSDSTVKAGARNLNWTLDTDSSWASRVRERLHAEKADTIDETLTRPDCDRLASALAARQAIEILPVTIYPYGTGYLLYQPSERGPSYQLLVIDSNLEVAQALGQVVFE